MNNIFPILASLIWWFILLLFFAFPASLLFIKIQEKALANFRPANWPPLIIPLTLLGLGFYINVFGWQKETGSAVVLAIPYSIILYIWVKINSEDELSKPDLVRRGPRVVDASALNARAESEMEEPGTAIIIGGVNIPRMLEAQHFLISGTTGAGKTQVINGMLHSIRKRHNRAIIADPAGGFYTKFSQERDLLLNPFDQRSVGWSPFEEIRMDYDCERIAKAIIPDGTGDSREWHHYAQTLIAQCMLAMHRKGEKSIKQLLYWLTTADQKELGGLLNGTPAAALCAKGNDKMLSSTRGIISTYLGVFQYLKDDGDFSIRKWIQDESRENWLFITYRDDQMGLLRNLVATFLEMALVEGLSLTENQKRGLWYIMDEVDSLGKISTLRTGLTKLRKYGGCCVLGLQTIAQLRETYGRDEAQTLVANTSVKCILRAGDAETAKSMEQELGEQEIERTQVSNSSSSNDEGTSKSQSISTQVVRQSAVLASEIMALPDLQGYVKIPGNKIARISIQYEAMPDKNPAFC